eukprot:RCo029597
MVFSKKPFSPAITRRLIAEGPTLFSRRVSESTGSADITPALRKTTSSPRIIAGTTTSFVTITAGRNLRGTSPTVCGGPRLRRLPRVSRMTGTLQSPSINPVCRTTGATKESSGSNKISFSGGLRPTTRAATHATAGGFRLPTTWARNHPRPAPTNPHTLESQPASQGEASLGQCRRERRKVVSGRSCRASPIWFWGESTTTFTGEMAVAGSPFSGSAGRSWGSSSAGGGTPSPEGVPASGLGCSGFAGPSASGTGVAAESAAAGRSGLSSHDPRVQRPKVCRMVISMISATARLRILDSVSSGPCARRAALVVTRDSTIASGVDVVFAKASAAMATRICALVSRSTAPSSAPKASPKTM